MYTYSIWYTQIEIESLFCGVNLCILCIVICSAQTNFPFGFLLGWTCWSCAVVFSVLVGGTSRSNIHFMAVLFLCYHNTVCAPIHCVYCHSNPCHMVLLFPWSSWFYLHLIVHTILLSGLSWEMSEQFLMLSVTSNALQSASHVFLHIDMEEMWFIIKFPVTLTQGWHIVNIMFTCCNFTN